MQSKAGCPLYISFLLSTAAPIVDSGWSSGSDNAMVSRTHGKLSFLIGSALNISSMKAGRPEPIATN
jgi:hypothetical protein